MYDLSSDKNGERNSLYVQPIIVKEFGQELDKPFAFMISSKRYKETYENLANNSIKKEVRNLNFNVYGEPDWCQNDYFEGIERYRNKYQEYVKLGIFKSKEVLPEAMVFFHDLVIANRLSEFMSNLEDYFTNTSKEDILINLNINPFFNFWMRTSGNVLKHKINIINSDEMVKDITEIERDLINTKQEFEFLLSYVEELTNQNTIQNLREYLEEFGNSILGKMDEENGEYGYNVINDSGQITLRRYVINITDEITTYAEGNIYGTPKERKEFRNDILKNVLKALENFK
jgi:hypothetical protein